ncbi:MAG TPA: tRNA lysidine(34) synthetase TilS [Bacilli bacterium]|nr:tRNA lysidine(34) synthetase TilS [Bacilli bacterium]
MDKVISAFFEEKKLELKNKKVLIATSTGVDSMVMLASFLRLRKEYKLDLYVAFVNHLKRKEANLEEEYIKSFCKENEIKLAVERLDYLDESENFQKEARKLRYQFFEKVIKKEKIDYLVLAHHANDNLETILMRILRGSNLAGYAGIESVVKYPGYTLVRPFINLEKEDIYRYALRENVKYFEDKSNIDTIYTRNKIRSLIDPEILKVNEQGVYKLEEYGETLKAAWRIVSKIVDEFIEKKVSNLSFAREDFLALDSYIQEEIIFKLLKKFNLSKENVLEIISLISSDKANIKTYFKNSFTFYKEYDKITIVPYLKAELDFELVIDKENFYYKDSKLEVKSKKDNLIDSKYFNICYNMDMFPLKLRTRKDGDKIKLKSGIKKVKDYLIDQKIGILEREDILILEDKDSNVLSIVGLVNSSLTKTCDYSILIRRINEKDN